ncbi:helix-turn-helix domain-containing protein [Psychrobacter sp. 16-MNA-CIBAN-0192]
MTYSADFRAQMIKNIEERGMSIREACTFYNVSKTTLHRWLKNPGIVEFR